MAAVGLSTRAALPNRDTSLIAAASAASVVLAATAVYSPKYAVAVVVAAGVLVLAFRRLALAVGVFVVFTFPEHLPGSLGAGATVAKPLGAVLALAWLASVVAERGATPLLPRDPPKLFWAVTAFVLLAMTSAIWATDFSPLRYNMTRLVPDVVLLLIVYTAATSAKAFRIIVWSFLIGSIVTAGYSIVTGGYAASGRLSALFDPNYFAARLIGAILIALFIALTTSSNRVRGAAAAVFLVDTIAFALTQSRGGIVGLAAALVAAVAVAGAARPRVLAATLALVALGAGYYVLAAPAHISGSFSTSLSGASAGRSDEWRIALRVFENHPLSGVGLGNYPVVEPSYSTQTVNLNFVRYIVNDQLVAHNSYLEIAAELGIAGLALFLAIVISPAVLAGRALSSAARAPNDLEFYARGLLAGAIGMFVAYIFLSAQYEKDLWLVLGLLAAVPALLDWRGLRSERGSVSTSYASR